MVGVLVSVSCTSANVPDQGTIRFFNDSDDPIAWITDASGRQFEQVLASKPELWSLRAGAEVPRRSSAQVTDPEWCEGALQMNWLVRARDGNSFTDRLDAPLNLADVEIVDQRGPGHCWGERNAEWRYPDQ